MASAFSYNLFEQGQLLSQRLLLCHEKQDIITFLERSSQNFRPRISSHHLARSLLYLQKLLEVHWLQSENVGWFAKRCIGLDWFLLPELCPNRLLLDRT